MGEFVGYSVGLVVEFDDEFEVVEFVEACEGEGAELILPTGKVDGDIGGLAGDEGVARRFLDYETFDIVGDEIGGEDFDDVLGHWNLFRAKINFVVLFFLFLFVRSKVDCIV